MSFVVPPLPLRDGMRSVQGLLDAGADVPLPSARGVLDAGWNGGKACAGARWPLASAESDLSPTESRPASDYLLLPPAETRIEVVEVEASVSPPCLFYKIEVCLVEEGRAVFPHYIRRRASDVQDFHAALQRELGTSKDESPERQLPALPVLFEFQTRLMGSKCQKVLNAYFSRLIRNQFAVETYTFKNFFQDRQRNDAPSSQSLQAAVSSPEGSWLLSSGSPLPKPLRVTTERFAFPRESQPEEEPSAPTEGNVDDAPSATLVIPPTIVDVKYALVEQMPRTVINLEHTRFKHAEAVASPGEQLSQHPSRASLKEEVKCLEATKAVHAPTDDKIDCLKCCEIPEIANLSDLLADLKLKNKELTERLREVEARAKASALLTKGFADACESTSRTLPISEPCPEPPRVGSIASLPLRS